MKRHAIRATAFSRRHKSRDNYSAARAGGGVGVVAAVDDEVPRAGVASPEDIPDQALSSCAKARQTPPFDNEATAEPFSRHIFFLAKQASPVPNW